MSKLDIQYKKGCIFVIWFCSVFYPAWYCLFVIKIRAVNNGQNLLNMMKVICWVHFDDRLKHDRLLILIKLSEYRNTARIQA